MRTARLTDYYDPEGREVDIPLDPLLTPQQNAAKYYKEYNKAKTAERVLTEQIEKGRRELDYLDSVLEAVKLAEGERDLLEIRQELTGTGYLRKGSKAGQRNLKVQTRPMEFRSSAGLRISVGKNNTQNDALTTRQAGKGELWFHTQKIHGSHVILWTEGGQPDLTSIQEAAQLAAQWQSGTVEMFFHPAVPAAAQLQTQPQTTPVSRPARPAPTCARTKSWQSILAVMASM